MRRPPRFCALAAFALLFLLASERAQAHGSRSTPPPPGIQIASLTHGQMAVIASYRGEIVDLAQRQTETGPIFRRLYNHGNLQFTYCLWGLMPRSLADEESPFNECSHAYLATAKALLAFMATMPSAQREAEELISEIDADMVRSGASWILCQFSGETFSTGEVIVPKWSDVLFHFPSLAALAAVVAALIAAAWSIVAVPLSRASGR
uniref:Transmembrane protein n=1 Tax=Mesorhizobium sp. F28 TaxID=491069 RepID=B0FL85_9HYPH|nr:unknown [Mesorhizobium sp. F28]